jgi:outer membrane protein OmpA-like peptidoglycan-associated protein
MIAVLLFVMANGTTLAQHSDTTSRIGVALGGAYALHSASFTDLPGMNSCCPEFTSGAGFGPTAGLEWNMPLSTAWRFGVRAGYASLPGIFTEEEFIGYALDGTGDDATVVRATSEHQLTTSMSAFEIMPRVQFRPFHDLGLGLHAVLDGQLLFGGSYEATEKLITPSDGIFADTRTNERGQASGDITNLSSFVLAVGIGVHWDLQLSDSWWLTPELSYYQGLMDVADLSYEPDASWKVSSIRAGLVVTMAMLPSPPPMTTASVPLPRLSAQVDSRELRSDDTEADIATVRIEETLSTQVYPLVPMIFFDENVSRLKTNTYRNLAPSQTREFREKREFTFDNTTAPDRAQVTLDVYRNILNIVGQRMRDQFPGARLTLTGCNADDGVERGATALSRQRADAVREYLTTVWGIANDRITVAAQGLPANPSKYTVTDGQDRADALEENRRVELSSATPELLAPVVINDTLREISPPRLKFRMSASGPGPMNTWSLTASHPGMPAARSGSTFLRDEGRGAPPASVVWARAASQREIPKSAEPIISMLAVTDAGGERIVVGDTLKVDYVTVERKKRERVGMYEVDQFRLALFGYEQTELNEQNRMILERFVTPSLQHNVIVEIDGFTDRKGERELNQRISRERASAVATSLGTSSARINGHGEGADGVSAPFANDTPEGRMYNRTVLITVKVPAP